MKMALSAEHGAPSCATVPIERWKRPRDMRKVLQLMLLATLLQGCASPEPVGRLRASPQTLSLGVAEWKRLRLDWEPLAPLDRVHGTPTVFVHVSDRTGRTHLTFDHPLPRPWARHQEQSYEIDLFQSALADALPPGTYRLTVGLYDDDWGHRWPLLTDGEEIDRREYVVATVEVPERHDTPRFSFEGDWLPLEPGDSQQILARRCLTGSGSIRIGGIAPDDSFLLLIYVGDTPGRSPRLRVEVDCIDLHRSLATGPQHRLEIGPPFEVEDCEIRLTPDPVTSSPARMCVEGMAWMRGNKQKPEPSGS